MSATNISLEAGQRKRSVLEDHLDIVGVLHDREVAEMLGMTAGGVRAYRQRHSIPAGWRTDGKTTTAPRRKAVRSTRKSTRSTPRRSTPRPDPMTARPKPQRRRAAKRRSGPERMAYTVTAETTQAGRVQCVALATTAGEAAAIALQHFQATVRGATLIDVRILATVL